MRENRRRPLVTATAAQWLGRAVTTPLLVLLTWSIAAMMAVGVDQTGLRHTTAGSVVSIATILGMGFVYARLAGRRLSLDHALVVGVVWLALSIAFEMFITICFRHGWYALLGTPGNHLLRVTSLLAWMFSPAIFAQRVSTSSE